MFMAYLQIEYSLFVFVILNIQGINFRKLTPRFPATLALVSHIAKNIAENSYKINRASSNLHIFACKLQNMNSRLQNMSSNFEYLS